MRWLIEWAPTIDLGCTPLAAPAILSGSVDDLLELAEIEPDHVAVVTGVDDHVTGSVIGIRGHAIAARRTTGYTLELVLADRYWIDRRS